MILRTIERRNIKRIQTQSKCRRHNEWNAKLGICFGKGRKHFWKKKSVLVTSIFYVLLLFPKSFFLKGR